MPMIPLLIGAGVGLLSAGETQLQANKQQKIAAATTQYSPWTGANINDAQAQVKPAHFFADAGAGALAGLAASQGHFPGTGGAGGANQTVNVTASAAGGNPAEGMKSLSQDSFWGGEAPALLAPTNPNATAPTLSNEAAQRAPAGLSNTTGVPNGSPNDPNQQPVGGKYGFGPAPGTFTFGPHASYGDPWAQNSPYWQKNPYGSS